MVFNLQQLRLASFLAPVNRHSFLEAAAVVAVGQVGASYSLSWQLGSALMQRLALLRSCCSRILASEVGIRLLTLHSQSLIVVAHRRFSSLLHALQDQKVTITTRNLDQILVVRHWPQRNPLRIYLSSILVNIASGRFRCRIQLVSLSQIATFLSLLALPDHRLDFVLNFRVLLRFKERQFVGSLLNLFLRAPTAVLVLLGLRVLKLGVLFYAEFVLNFVF